MALVVVCDKCGRIVDDNVDHVELHYNYKLRAEQILPFRETVTLCDKCYKEVMGDQLEVLKKGGKINA